MTWAILNYETRKEQLVIEQLEIAKIDWFIPTLLASKRRSRKGPKQMVLKGYRLTPGWLFIDGSEFQQSWTRFIPFTSGLEIDGQGSVLTIPARQMALWMQTLTEINLRIRKQHEKGEAVPKVKKRFRKMDAETLESIKAELFGPEKEAA